MKFKRFRSGSLSVGLSLGSSGFTDSQSAATSFTNSVSGNSIDGVSYLSSSVTASGFSSTSSSSTNLGLVLGLSIPLSILLILVIVILVYSFRKETEDDEDGQGQFYSEDVMDKKDDI